MKLIKTLALSTFIAASLFSCGGESEKESGDKTEITKAACTFSYIPDSTNLKWTAYKFNARAGVSGTFNQITVSNTSTSENPLDVLAGATFNIETSTVNSGDPERDPKLVAHFFNNLIATEAITGKIVSIKDGEAVVTIKMNDKSVDVIGKILENHTKVSLKVSINMADFDGLNAITTLNEVCSAKHTDEDGESKLWPDVDIIVSTVLKKDCM